MEGAMLPASVNPQQNEIYRTQELVQIIKKQNPNYVELFTKIANDAKNVESQLTNLCRTIAHFETSTEKSKRFRKLNDTYPELNGVQLPFTFHLKKKSNGKIHLSITNLGKTAVLGLGKYRKVKSGLKTKIAKERKSSGRLDYSAIGRSLRGKSDRLKTIKNTQKFHKNIYQMLTKEERALFAKTPSTKTYKDKNGVERIEQFTPWYNGDLHLTINYGAVPVTPQKNGPFKEISFLENLNVITDAGDALTILHGKGYVHRDVKTPNIMVELTPDLNVHGLLNDFDLGNKINQNLFKANYPFWDPLGRLGIVTENSDTFGLAFSLMETMFPTIYLRLKEHNKFDEIASEKFIANEIVEKTEGLFKKLKLIKNNESLPKIPSDQNLKDEATLENYLAACLEKSRELTVNEKLKIDQYRAELKSIVRLAFLCTEYFKNSYKLLDQIQNTSLMKNLTSDQSIVRKKAFEHLEALQTRESKETKPEDAIVIPTTKEFTDRVKKEKLVLENEIMNLRKGYIKSFKKREVTGTIYSKVKGGYIVQLPSSLSGFKGFVPSSDVKARDISLKPNQRHLFVIQGFDSAHNTVSLALRPLTLDYGQHFTELPGSVKPADLSELKVGQLIIVMREGPPPHYQTVEIVKIARDTEEIFFKISENVESHKSIRHFYTPI